MNVLSILEGVLSNALWWIVGLVIIFLGWWLRRFANVFRAVPMALRLRKAGLNRFSFSRHDYPEQLDAYLDRAKSSIRIVSISLRITGTECALSDLFRRKLASNPNFEICISLLKPDSHASQLAARALNMPPEVLNAEIRDMLRELIALRDSLPAIDRGRFRILTHNCLPMGSAILIDTTPSSGVIQIETKLYGSPRVESFSFEVVAPSDFYSRNLSAWNAVIAESKVV